MRIDISLDLTEEQIIQFKQFIGYGYTGMIHHECKTAGQQNSLIDLTNQLNQQIQLNEPDEEDETHCWRCGSTNELDFIEQQNLLLCGSCRGMY